MASIVGVFIKFFFGRASTFFPLEVCGSLCHTIHALHTVPVARALVSRFDEAMASVLGTRVVMVHRQIVEQPHSPLNRGLASASS